MSEVRQSYVLLGKIGEGVGRPQAPNTNVAEQPLRFRIACALRFQLALVGKAKTVGNVVRHDHNARAGFCRILGNAGKPRGEGNAMRRLRRKLCLEPMGNPADARLHESR